MPGSDLLKSVLRSVDVLDAVSRSGDGLSLQELVERLGVNGTTLYNLLRTLVSRDILEISRPGRRYRLGRHLIALAGRGYTEQVVRVSGSAVSEIVRGCGALTAWFACGRGSAVTAFFRVTASHPHWLQRSSERLHPYGNICSLVFQAFSDSAFRSAFFSRYGFSSHGTALWGDLSSYEAFLSEVRHLGYGELCVASGSGECEYAAGFPIFGSDGVVSAVLGARFGADAGDGDEGLSPEVLSAMRQHASAIQSVYGMISSFVPPWDDLLPGGGRDAVSSSV